MVSEGHPYSPRDLHLPGYVPCSLSQSNILSVFAFFTFLLVSLTWIFSGKEYSKGDSRYAGRDAGIVSVEGLTAVFGGPASLLAVYAIATGKSYSHILQFAISLSQLYGVGVYYITALLEGDNFAASKLYYYAYYIGANASWIVYP
ncbi:putative 3-beta-hydroxysteroid-Delta(8),Delta(7)-isomerase [Arachis hypogaea]|nr:putative 3-beta-hydroxysteroid-Delta(8),Delta(7)-isomerase [Arachis hypogaea]